MASLPIRIIPRGKGAVGRALIELQQMACAGEVRPSTGLTVSRTTQGTFVRIDQRVLRRARNASSVARWA